MSGSVNSENQPVIEDHYLGAEEEMIFDNPEPQKVRIKLGNKLYYLIEADAGAAAKYKSAAARAARMQDGKVVGVDNIGDIEPLLVALCLAETNDDGSIRTHRVGQEDIPKTVSIAAVRKMKNSIIAQLFEKAKKISKLGDEDTIAGLEKRIAEDTERLASMKKAAGGTEGNEVDTGINTSTLPTS